jgi:hypothetical protein
MLPAYDPRAASLLRAAASNLDCVPAGRRAAAPPASVSCLCLPPARRCLVNVE